MNVRFKILALLLAMLLIMVGCYTQIPAAERPSMPVPAEENYYGFSTADELAAWLRADSDAGVLIAARRGGPAPGFPRNAIPTFQRTLQFGPALIHADVRMTRDSVLVLRHDERLDRTTTGGGHVSDKSLAELRRLRLLDQWAYPTPFGVNTLAETLAWAEGRAVLMLDVNEGVPPEAMVDLIERHNAGRYAAVIAHEMHDLTRYHELMPELVLVAQAATTDEARTIIESGVDLDRLVAYTGRGGVQQEVRDLLRDHNIRTMTGTFGDIDRKALDRGPETYAHLIEEGADILLTDTPHVALDAARKFERIPVPGPLTSLPH